MNMRSHVGAQYSIEGVPMSKMKIFAFDYTRFKGSKEIPNELKQGLDPHAYIKRGHIQ